MYALTESNQLLFAVCYSHTQTRTHAYARTTKSKRAGRSFEKLCTHQQHADTIDLKQPMHKYQPFRFFSDRTVQMVNLRATFFIILSLYDFVTIFLFVF